MAGISAIDRWHSIWRVRAHGRGLGVGDGIGVAVFGGGAKRLVNGVLLPPLSSHVPPCSVAYFRCFRIESA
jgi:hypothetical protein